MIKIILVQLFNLKKEIHFITQFYRPIKGGARKCIMFDVKNYIVHLLMVKKSMVRKCTKYFAIKKNTEKYIKTLKIELLCVFA